MKIPLSTTPNTRFEPFEWLAMALVTLGALNWGLVGLSEFVGGNLNVVDQLLGSAPAIEAVVSLLVGLGGLAMVAVATRRYRHRTGELELERSGAAR